MLPIPQRGAQIAASFCKECGPAVVKWLRDYHEPCENTLFRSEDVRLPDILLERLAHSPNDPSLAVLLHQPNGEVKRPFIEVCWTLPGVPQRTREHAASSARALMRTFDMQQDVAAVKKTAVPVQPPRPQKSSSRRIVVRRGIDIVGADICTFAAIPMRQGDNTNPKCGRTRAM